MIFQTKEIALFDKLKQSEECYRSIVENVPVGIYRSSSAKGGRFIEVNPVLVKMLGYESIEELKNIPVINFYYQPEDREIFINKLKTEGMVKDQEIFLVKKNGDIILALISARVRFADSGEISYIDGFVQDITERKRYENLLKLQASYFKTLIENAPTAIQVIDIDGSVKLWNKAGEKILGYSETEVLGKNAYYYVHHTDQKKLKNLLSKILTNPEVNYSLDIKYRCKDKTWKIISTTMTNYLKDPVIKGILINFQDITERTIMAEQIKKSLLEKEMLLKEIHHRVKNNLSMVTSLVVLQENSADDPKIKAELKSLESRIKAVYLVHEHLYKSDTLATVNLDQHISKLFKELFYIFNSVGTQIKYEINIAKDLEVEHTKAMPISLMTNEIITNIFKYAFPADFKREKKVSIKIQENDNFIEYEISDNGVGIDKEINLKEVFSLGTQLIRMLSDQIKGKLEFDSNENGTTYKIKFPK